MLFCLLFQILTTFVEEILLDTLEGRIVGGEPAKVESFPFTVKFFNRGALCSGTILNSWSVLTAAHCFDHNKDIDEMLIVAGSRYMYDHQAESYDVLRFLIHENYNKPIAFACDIALIFVTRPITFDKRTQKGILVNTKRWMDVNETHFFATGWGMTKYGGPISEQGLIKTKLRYVPKGQCERMHNMKFSKDMFCLYGDGDRDTCKGDSGGGILWNRMVIGVVSHGDGCAKMNKPSLYANVWHFRPWIRRHVEDFFNNFCTFNQAM